MAKVELVTKNGHRFTYESFVDIGDKSYPISDLTEEQRNYVFAQRDVQALNAAYAGQYHFRAEGLRPFEEVFPEIAAERMAQKKKRAR